MFAEVSETREPHTGAVAVQETPQKVCLQEEVAGVSKLSSRGSRFRSGSGSVFASLVWVCALMSQGLCPYVTGSVPLCHRSGSLRHRTGCAFTSQDWVCAFTSRVWACAFTSLVWVCALASQVWGLVAQVWVLVTQVWVLVLIITGLGQRLNYYIVGHIYICVRVRAFVCVCARVRACVRVCVWWTALWRA